MAREAANHEGVNNYRLIATLVCGKSTFQGKNSRKTHPRLMMTGNQNEDYSNHHAEMAALLSAQRRLGRAEFEKQAHKIKLYVMRLSAGGNLANAKPCRHCQKRLDEAGILRKNVFHTTNGMSWKRVED